MEPVGPMQPPVLPPGFLMTSRKRRKTVPVERLEKMVAVLDRRTVGLYGSQKSPCSRNEKSPGQAKANDIGRGLFPVVDSKLGFDAI